VIRHGFKFYGKKIRCAYFQPAHALNDETLAQYRRNRLVVTRQVNFSPDTQQSIDMLLSFNGIPVATVELKNHLTGQSFRNSIHQYKTDRDPKVKLFAFKKRALVHFALDAEVAFMTTRLARAKTRFLPFNRGASGGAGNPQHPSGHRTAYLWQDVWQFDSLTVWRATRGSSAATSTTPSSRRCCSGCSLGAFTTSSAQSNGGAGSQLRPLASSQNACIRLTTR
jgi:type I restriction enzyme R subunit